VSYILLQEAGHSLVSQAYLNLRIVRGLLELRTGIGFCVFSERVDENLVTYLWWNATTVEGTSRLRIHRKRAALEWFIDYV
jgi:hypothetical protein